MKKCFKCELEKPFTEFYVHNQMADGYLNKCRSCAKNDANKHRAENLEKIREYDRVRGKNADRIKKSAEITKIWRAQDKRRSVAHNIVARAIRKGDLCPKPCERCNSEKSIAHHEDYDQPLNVVWLCQSCHKKRHIELLTLGELP